MKRQKEEEKEEQKKETEYLAELTSLIAAVQPASVYSNASNRNSATEAVNVNSIIKQ